MPKRKQRADEEFIVEYIIEARLEGKGSKDWKYLVKWYGYPESENSLEPQSNLHGCERLLKSFWEQFPEHKKWEWPQKAKSSKAWIEKEKRFFAQRVKKPAKKKARTDSTQTAESSQRRASAASTSTTSTAPTRRSQRHVQSAAVSPIGSARSSRSSSLSSVPPSPPVAKNPSPVPAPAPVASTSSSSFVKKRRTPRDKPKVNTDDDEDDEDDDDDDESDGEETDEEDRPLNKLKGKGKAVAPAARVPERARPTVPVRRNTTTTASQPGAALKARAASFSTSAANTAPRSPAKSSTLPSAKSAPTPKPAPATAPIVISPSPPPMEVEEEQWEKDSLFDGGDDDEDQEQTATRTAPHPPESPLTPMSAFSSAATKPAEPRGKLTASASEVSPASAGPSRLLRPTVSTSAVGPGARKPTLDSPSVPKVPAHRQKPRLQPLPFNELPELNAGGNSTKVDIIRRMNSQQAKPALAIHTSASPKDASPGIASHVASPTAAPGCADSGSRNVSLEPASAKLPNISSTQLPTPSSSKPYVTSSKLPEASSAMTQSTSTLKLPPEMEQFSDIMDWEAAPTPEAAPPAMPATAPLPEVSIVEDNSSFLDGQDMVMSPVAMSDPRLGSVSAKSLSPPIQPLAVATVPAQTRDTPVRPHVAPALIPVPSSSGSPSVAAQPSHSPVASSSTNVASTSVPATGPAPSLVVAPTPSLPPAPKKPLATSVPAFDSRINTAAIANSSSELANVADEWLNAFSADLGKQPAPTQSQQPLPGTLGRIPKKWHWEGDLLLGDGDAPMCGVRLHEPWPSQPPEPVFKVLFNSSKTSFRLQKTYPVEQAWMFFPLFEAKQWAKIVPPESGADMAGFTGFAAYMMENSLFSIARLPAHSPNATHHIVVFHNSLQAVTSALKCPTYMMQTPQMVAAIVVPAHGDPKRPPAWIDVARYNERRAAQLTQRISAQKVQASDLALPHRLGVKLPETLANQLNGSGFTIYTADLARHSDKRAMVLALGQETTDLMRASSCAGGTFRSLYDAVPFIFIHRDNWRMMHVEHHNLPGLKAKRTEESANRQFWLYGTSPLWPLSSQGLELKQVFLYGGIVTFTARAVAENPRGVEALIKRIDKHPLWMCYVLPEVVALVREMTDANSPYEKSKLADGVSAVSALLGPIEKRRISLLNHPPPSWDDDACREWIMGVSDNSEKKPLEVLDYCIEKLAAHKRPEGNKEEFVNELVFEDLRQVESNPIIGTTYRRFVAIVEDTPPESIPVYEGWERKNLKYFRFGDNLDHLNGEQSTNIPAAAPVAPL